jgi:hypothetical protein
MGKGCFLIARQGSLLIVSEYWYLSYEISIIHLIFKLTSPIVPSGVLLLRIVIGSELQNDEKNVAIHNV